MKYSDLSEAEVAFLSQGCGAKDSWIKIPDYCSKYACDKHDVAYWIGGPSEKDRLLADQEFLADMKKSSHGSWLCLARAQVYYYTVRWGGKPHFNFGKKRDRSDLQREIFLTS